tara:strand:- start:425 stop:985 length:561 start_codon:yes stop_codon:yes gene_type:complete
MHNNFLKIFIFIDCFNLNDLSLLNKNINLIYRNYDHKIDINTLLKLKDFCKKTNRRLYLSNNFKVALKLDLDGVYIPSFNKKINFVHSAIKKNFDIIGSAHNIQEINIKSAQKCSLIFLSPLFKNNKNKKNLDITKFNLLTLNYKENFVALGGINYKNLKKIRLTKSCGIAGISGIKEIKKNGPKN